MTIWFAQHLLIIISGFVAFAKLRELNIFKTSVIAVSCHIRHEDLWFIHSQRGEVAKVENNIHKCLWYNTFIANFTFNSWCIITLTKKNIISPNGAFTHWGENLYFVRLLHSLCSLKNYSTDLLKIIYCWGQEIHCWHSYWATMFEWPRKSKSTSGSRGTDDFVL